jgi:hypothetical protein
MVKTFISEWIWQLPQNLCGLIYKYISKNNRINKVVTEVTKSLGVEALIKKSPGSVSLGKYIFLSPSGAKNNFTIDHECGHSIQSKKLGPLYLFIIGIPSILHATLNGLFMCCIKDGEYNYYHFYTEKNANKQIEEFKNKL